MKAKKVVKRVELVDLTEDFPQNIVLKEGYKKFKVSLSFNPETYTLRIHFLEIPLSENS